MSVTSIASIVGNLTQDVGTGINVQSVVAEIMAAHSGPLIGLENQQSAFTSQTSALNNISSLISTLQTSIQGLSDINGALNAQQVTSSNTNVLTGTAGATAAAGTHTIVVSNLATTSSYYSAEQLSGSATLSNGSFQIQVGSGKPITIDVNATNNNNTLDSLAEYINGLGDGFSANVITDAGGSRLAIVSGTSGAPGDLTISNDTVGLGFTKAVKGVNANVTVDGVPVFSTTNTITSAIQGVSINLLSGDPGTSITMTVGPDTSQATSAVNSFISAYNAVVQAINAQYATDPSSGQAGVLADDSTLAAVQAKLATDVNYSISGNGGIVNLASLGINTSNDGTLTLDSSTFDSALSSSYQNVISFFQNTSNTGFAQSFNSDLNSNLANPTSGLIALDLNGVSQSQQALSDQISQFQANATEQQQSLMSEFSTIDTTLQELPTLENQISSMGL